MSIRLLVTSALALVRSLTWYSLSQTNTCALLRAKSLAFVPHRDDFADIGLFPTLIMCPKGLSEEI